MKNVSLSGLENVMRPKEFENATRESGKFSLQCFCRDDLHYSSNGEIVSHCFSSSGHTRKDAGNYINFYDFYN